MKNRQGYFVFSLAIVIFIFACNFLQPQQRETPATFTPLPLSTTTPTPEHTPTSIQTESVSNSIEIEPTIDWIKDFTNPQSFVIDTKTVRSVKGNIYVLVVSQNLSIPENERYLTEDLTLIKFTKDGDKLWDFKFDAGVQHFLNYPGFSLILDNEENAYVSEKTTGSWGTPINAFKGKNDDDDPTDVFVAKINSEGIIVWNTFLNGLTYPDMVLDNNNDILIVTTREKEINEPLIYDTFLVLMKLSKEGEILWTTQPYDGFITEYGIDLGDTGDFYASYADYSKLYAAKFLSNGDPIWNVFLGESIYLMQISQELDGQDNIYIIGTSRSSSLENPLTRSNVNGFEFVGTFLTKIDMNGNLLWNIFLDSDIHYRALEFDQINGNLYVVGSYQGENAGGIIIELDSNGSVVAKISLAEAGIGEALSIAPGNNKDFYITGKNDSGKLLVSHISLIPEPVPTAIPEAPDEAKYREGGPLVPEITTYIPTPKDISTDPLIIIINLALAFSIAVLVLPFSITLDIFLGWVHGISDRFLDWRKQIQEKTINILGLKLSREQRSYIDTLKPIAEIFNLFIVILFYGVVFSLLDPDWNIFSLKGIVLLVEMVVAYGIVGIFDDIIQWFYIRRWGTPGKFTVRITNVILAGASVIISRSIPLSPGLMFGSPEAVRIDESVLGKNRIWFLTKISLISYVVIGLLAWIPTIILDFLVQQELQVLPQTVKDIIAGIEGFMLIVFAVSLENVFIQLIGFSGGIGKKVREKNWLLWLAVWIPVAFLFLQTLLNPRNDFFNGFQSRNAFFALACMAGFIVIVLAMALIKFLISRNVVKK